jgi:hypothetical protein
MCKGKHAVAVFVVTGLALATAGAWASGPEDIRKLPFAEFWALGTSTKQTCNTTQTCISGTGSGRLKVSFAPEGPLALLTVDTGNATPNGFGGKCAAVGGTVTFSPPGDATEMLVLEIQGSDCQIGAEPSLSEITATYLVDTAASTGRFNRVTGGGSFNWAVDASGSPTSVQFAGVGVKEYPSSPI